MVVVVVVIIAVVVIVIVVVIERIFKQVYYNFKKGLYFRSNSFLAFIVLRFQAGLGIP